MKKIKMCVNHPNRVAVNSFHSLCIECNQKRLSEARGRTANKVSAKIDADEIAYEEVFNHSNHKCEECGAQLNTVFRSEDGRVNCRFRYSHILPKSTYPKLRHVLMNFNNLCLSCHEKWENGDKSSMRIYKKNEHRIKIMMEEF